MKSSTSEHAALLRTILTLWVSVVGLVLSGGEMRAETIRVGVLAFLGAEHSLEEWGPTARAIETGLPGTTVRLVPLDHAGLDRAVAGAEIDFLITNPGHYVELESAQGVSRIATLDSGAPVASAVLVRADRRDLRTLADLAGKRVAIVGTTAFGGFQAAWREFAAAGLDPFRDFSGLDSVGFPMTRVIDAVVANRVDAGIVRGCVKEQREAEGALAPGALRVLAPMPTSATACALSSRVYPDWPFAKLRGTPTAMAKRVATALLTFDPPAGAAAWTVPLDYQPVHEAFRDLKIGPYEPLRHISARDVLARYWQLLAVLGIALGAWAVHVLRVERLVRRRTAELATVNGDLRHEIERRRRVEEQEALHRKELDHAARLSILGEMAGGMAHELNQPLAAIANYADGCELRLKASPVDTTALMQGTRLIRQQAERAAQVIQRMRAFVRKREPTQAVIDAGEVVAEAVELFEGLARRTGVRIETVVVPALPAVMGDRIQLQQVLLNLLQNAVDASAGHGAGPWTVRVEARSEEGGVAITVADQGAGMTEEVRARLFEPFFTTKPDGLGLGLALCHSIVEEHRGRLQASLGAGGGTVMRLWLPRATAAEGAAA
ncbi:PhnD/SsuA/transferrin family substrate-binding protein [Rhodoplanes sp.]|uniref:sensor histidine kinase n=1 Tax=Rhodoplanes sp. TaxID=1968906 RepID=UPI0025F3A808|nr:PhnD/SsuA/transferrin family substrate-binding protein [Rhodoplanes sp.]